MSDICEDNLSLGIVQTTLDAELAWPSSAEKPQISLTQDEHAWLELCKAMRFFHNGDITPNIIIIPELALPRTRIKDFNNMVGALNVIAVVGIDYKLDTEHNVAKNQGLIFVPKNYFQDRPSRSCTTIAFGKTYPAPAEERNLKELNPSWSFGRDDNVYIIDCGKFGKIGVSICYDFMDIERALMYRGRIQHLFVLAYNRDLGMFRSLADSLSRTVFCNVVICNTGFYGGSLVVSPYYEPYRRTIYEHNGKGLFSTQVVNLPVKGLRMAQCDDIKINNKQIWKTPPPGVKALNSVESTEQNTNFSRINLKESMINIEDQ